MQHAVMTSSSRTAYLTRKVAVGELASVIEVNQQTNSVEQKTAQKDKHESINCLILCLRTINIEYSKK